MQSAKMVTVIETVSRGGTGIEKDPNRDIIQYWSLDGKLLATRDELSEVLDEMKKFTERCQ